jgi:mannose/fructose-specific phosphotransferase system component IIA
MNANTSPPATEKTYEGAPEEVGAEILVDALGPTLNAAINSQTPGQVMRMIAGMTAGLAFMVAENYGPQAAAEMLTGTAANVMNNATAFDKPN